MKNLNWMRFVARLHVVAPLLVVSACDASVVSGAAKASFDGDVISNELMAEMYPRTFVAGSPRYLERDFEAGADFICDEIKVKYKRDLCSEHEINWR